MIQGIFLNLSHIRGSLGGSEKPKISCRQSQDVSDMVASTAPVQLKQLLSLDGSASETSCALFLRLPKGTPYLQAQMNHQIGAAYQIVIPIGPIQGRWTITPFEVEGHLVPNPGAPSIYIPPSLGPKVQKYVLFWGIWSPRVVRRR